MNTDQLTVYLREKLTATDLAAMKLTDIKTLENLLYHWQAMAADEIKRRKEAQKVG